MSEHEIVGLDESDMPVARMCARQVIAGDRVRMWGAWCEVEHVGYFNRADGKVSIKLRGRDEPLVVSLSTELDVIRRRCRLVLR